MTVLLDDKRRALAAEMRERRTELEHEAMARTFQLSGSTVADDAEYLVGLQSAISTAVAYGIDCIEAGDSVPATIPSPLLAQARLAARNKVKVEAVLRRYFNGYRIFSRVLAEVGEHCGCNSSELEEVVAELDRLFDALLAGIAAEYEREEMRRLDGARGLRLQHIQRLLNAEAVDQREIDYPLNGHHLAAVVAGRDIEDGFQQAAAALDRALLTLRIGEEETWVWLGGRRRFAFEELNTLLRGPWQKGTVAFGEPAHGVDGWRLSHKQAQAAISVARLGSVVRYAHVALVIAAQKDPFLSRSLREIFLVPFEGSRDGGNTYRAILRAYIDKGHNVSAAAKAAGVSRRTVDNHIQIAEAQLGPIAALTPALDAALRLEELSRQG